MRGGGDSRGCEINPRTLEFAFEVFELLALWRQGRVSASPKIVCIDQVVLAHHVPLGVSSVYVDFALKKLLAVLQDLMFALTVLL